MDNQPDLELVQTKNLIKELKRRFDTIVIVTSESQNDEFEEGCYFFSGNYLAAIGLCVFAQHKLLEDYEQDSQSDIIPLDENSDEEDL